jgi:hypothetical protein
MDSIQLPTPQPNERGDATLSEIFSNAIPTFQKDFKSLTESRPLWQKTLQLYETETFTNRLQNNAKPNK